MTTSSLIFSEWWAYLNLIHGLPELHLSIKMYLESYPAMLASKSKTLFMIYELLLNTSFRIFRKSNNQWWVSSIWRHQQIYNEIEGSLTDWELISRGTSGNVLGRFSVLYGVYFNRQTIFIYERDAVHRCKRTELSLIACVHGTWASRYTLARISSPTRPECNLAWFHGRCDRNSANGCFAYVSLGHTLIRYMKRLKSICVLICPFALLFPCLHITHSISIVYHIPNVLALLILCCCDSVLIVPEEPFYWCMRGMIGQCA